MDPTEFILPLAGIALIVVLVWLTGGARLYPMSKAAANAALQAEDLNAERISIGRTGRTGLAWLAARQRIALLRRMGRDIGVTVLEPGDISRLDIRGDPPVLTLRFNSIGQSPASLEFPDMNELQKWQKALMLYGKLEGSTKR